ncbi:hypothetical protein WA026_004147 [Henosepilachna vigintioctopunctata]|uniref:Uncharacterized protein n=1 Tax=Henosepilachna vigintioctopunctata TaxID=420089 RepID=A0AAW1UF32_9CUCU
MDLRRFFILLGLTVYIFGVAHSVHAKGASQSTAELQDSLKQWNDYELICGFPSTELSMATFYNIANNTINSTGNAWEMNTRNISNSLETGHHTYMLIGGKNQSMRQIIINYENFECCLKNIVMNIRNTEQRERCLASFFRCVLKSETEKCKTEWRFYMYFILHNRKYVPVFVLMIVILSMSMMCATNQFNDQFPNLGRAHFRRDSVQTDYV